MATVLALCVGALALVRYYSRNENTFLFIGTGFFVTGLLDAYHAVVTMDGFTGAFLPVPDAAVKWSWLAARLFLSMQLWLSWLAWRREQRLGEAG
ncbi:MAG TPA: MASE3 domain-containing protein, partial [Gammaproteobacteria bacterium]|nr:MASE3 domain-containing protein [Gammaproteobacteria bacterium]